MEALIEAWLKKREKRGEERGRNHVLVLLPDDQRREIERKLALNGTESKTDD